MPRYFHRLATLAKIQPAAGVDAVPTGAANAMLMTNIVVTELAGEEESRDLYLPYFGHQGVLQVGLHVQAEGSIEIAGAGAAGTAPAYGPLLRACGLAETIDDGVSVTYTPAQAPFEMVSCYWNLDGVNHAFLGARGSVSLSFEPKKIPRWRFKLWGLLGPITDVALPAVDTAAFVDPIAVSKTNTPVFSLHGAARIGERLELDLGNAVVPRFRIGDESIEITDRKASGTAVVEAASVATIDWFGRAAAGTRGTLALQHGTVAGNIVELAAPSVQLGRPAGGQSDNIRNYSLPLMLCPVAGGDEISLVIR